MRTVNGASFEDGDGLRRTAPGVRRTAFFASPRPMLGELLIEQGALTRQLLRHVLRVQRRTADRIGILLTHLGICSEVQIAEAVAVQCSLPRATERDLQQDMSASGLVPEAVCRRYNLVPLRVAAHRLQIAMVDPADPDAHAALARHTRLRLDIVVATTSELVSLMRDIFRDELTALSVYGLANHRPDESARRVFDERQAVVLTGFGIALALCVFAAPILSLTVAGAAAMVFYAASAAFKVWAVHASIDSKPALAIYPEDAAAIADDELPIYTVLVPLYREIDVLPRLVRGLTNLDYPSAKLDVKLLLEEDDVHTIAAARAMQLPAFIDIVVTPHSQPKTKPKSCNFGLLYARGKYTVIFDAEDVPERDQLRKAVAAFRIAPEKVVCLQGQLNYYNRDQNLLTRWFTGEYSGWFDMVVPGLDHLGMPIPLGGTSNHFVTQVLVELGAWDPFNVTEDADLGIRLFHAGYQTASLTSTTFEEANSELFNWIRQRSRWVKGYIQSWLVHMRTPISSARRIGVRNFLGFQAVIGGTFLVFLLNPVQWAVLLLWCLTQAHVVRQLFPGALYYLAWISFMLGNFAFVYVNAIAILRRGYWGLLGSALISPLYWALMSIAAWRGLLQLIRAPSFWEKTEHGLDAGVDVSAAQALIDAPARTRHRGPRRRAV